VPNNPTILLTTAGMVQFVPYFLGLEKPPFNPPRAVSCQKCARAGGKDSDIENVGRTPRHHTFFEMLGNFSFGEYFKEEAVAWGWDFVINYLKLDVDRLWITIFEEDDEAGEIWKKTGVAPERILKKGKKDNFWGPPGTSGPCGPCSEIHYDLGDHLRCSNDCSIATCECDRWMEIWNLVFMELFQDEDGNHSQLEKKNVDTGMGLERISMICQNVDSTFETDMLRPILDKVCEITGKKYKESEKTDISLRIITDHARCVSFMISDGISASNEGRGYVLRMILRRALRHGYILGLELPFMRAIVEKVIEVYKETYPELQKNREKIINSIENEENRFKATLQKGYGHIENLIGEIKAAKNSVISGAEAFKLYDTYGFPLELSEEIAHENGLSVDRVAFTACMDEQKERARASAQKTSVANDVIYAGYPDTKFVGYDQTSCKATVLALVSAGESITESKIDQDVDVILDTTPFYAESGGQIGDIGEFKTSDGTIIDVLDTFKVGKIFVHRTQGALKVGEKITATISKPRRDEISRHHSMAHLLQAALILVLGDEVKQAGSQVEEKRTRYDFSFPRAMTEDEIAKTEAVINDWINTGLCGKTDIMSIEDAQKSGAIALFGEKYDEKVRVVNFLDEGGNVLSSELCGGCHVQNVKDLRLIKIISEGAISGGTRRIEALCSNSAFEYLNAKNAEMDRVSRKYKLRYDQIDDKITKLLEQNNELSAKIGQMEAERAKAQFDTFISKARDVDFKGVKGKVFISKIEEFAPNAVKTGAELLAEKLGESIVVLCSVKSDGSIIIVAKVTDNFVKAGVNAGKIVSEIARATGGNGGGKPQMAQGAGKDAAKLDEILQNIKDMF